MRLEDRFWSKVNRDGPIQPHCPELGPCWVWDAAAGGQGYGDFGWQGKVWAAHRVSWTLANGPIPIGMCVLHKCDYTPCVRPSHLFLGTRADNSRDMVAKGRNGSSRPETRAKVSLTLQGIQRSAETRARISVARKGTHLSAETRARISASKKGQRIRPHIRLGGTR